MSASAQGPESHREPAVAREDAVSEDLLRRLAPQVLGALIRRYGVFDAAEDAVQEALIAASVQWPRQGRPDDPRGWLITVASRRLTDQFRGETARQRREATAAALAQDQQISPGPDADRCADQDDTLVLLVLCCHPVLSPSSQVALTLRAVGGLSTAQIARAFLVPEATMAQRISRAKQRIREAGAGFHLSSGSERQRQLNAALHVLYLIFNEGYTATSGPALQRSELTGEAIRLARMVRRLLPEDGEVAGLLALMLLTDARRPARTGADGALVPLAEQDRGKWDPDAIGEGIRLITDSLARSPIGPYQLQAAIAAVHAEATSAEDTDWPQILALYQLLENRSSGPVVTLNHAVAVAMVHGPGPGLAMVDALAADPRMSDHHRLHAVRAHLLEMAGDAAGARSSYQTAARRTTSLPEQQYLEARAARLLPAEKSARGSSAI
ncbi:RNA polymerase sigma factor [Nocardiopsis ansamitocini]|uniref:RNA polymerase sigma24 factor n=1 Tax=Nocardiopsis ansamitocini TaxID=1670832 RepID=A0A9W6P813_9ACTN|nr:sigma-70 family RNA polymerase sigma factor [Nocardiopsis ansamitocini]GLU48718.1 RNA polymerase sigma24 factor [Nocardiopsis ansamitocini]